MLSIQGLIITFMFGVIVGIIIDGLLNYYHMRKQLNEGLSKEFMSMMNNQ